MILLVLSLIPLSQARAEPSVDRSGFGNSSRPLWSELTPFEIYALDGLPAAQAGDADALLALYVLAAGSTRDLADYQRYRSEIDTWFRETGVAEHALGPAQAGRHLFQSMHRRWLGADESAAGVPLKYDAAQSQLPLLFDTGEFNCISSALLYIVVARKAGLEVDGVLVPSHTFVQLQADQDTVIDIETTSLGGYGQLHDEAFYETAGDDWFSDRALAPPSFAAYQARQIVSPTSLGLFNMINQHTAEERMAYFDRMRLAEIRAEQLPGDVEAQKSRLAYYYREFSQFSEAGAYDTAARMYDQVAPYLADQESRGYVDVELAGMLTAVQTQWAETLVHTGRPDEGLELARRLLESRDLTRPMELALEEHLFSVLGRYSLLLSHDKAFSRARRAFDSLELRCLENALCGSHLAHLYSSWALHYIDRDNWSRSADVYSEYLALDATSPMALQLSANLEKVYVTWAAREEWEGEGATALELLGLCMQAVDSPGLCEAAYDELESKLQAGYL